MDKNRFLAETLGLGDKILIPKFHGDAGWMEELILAGRRKLAEMWSTHLMHVELVIKENYFEDQVARINISRGGEHPTGGEIDETISFRAVTRSVPEAVRDVFFVALGGEE